MVADASTAKAKKTRKVGPIQALHPKADRIREYFFSGAPGAIVLWCAIIFACVAALVAFYVFSGFGGPSQPAYAGF